jgi:hypothetical protein
LPWSACQIIRSKFPISTKDHERCGRSAAPVSTATSWIRRSRSRTRRWRTGRRRRAIDRAAPDRGDRRRHRRPRCALIMIVEIYRRLAMAFNGARCRWAAYVRARSALIIGARGHAKARRHGGDEPSAFRTPGCRSSAAVRSCADPPERGRPAWVTGCRRRRETGDLSLRHPETAQKLLPSGSLRSLQTGVLLRQKALPPRYRRRIRDRFAAALQVAAFLLT